MLHIFTFCLPDLLTVSTSVVPGACVTFSLTARLSNSKDLFWNNINMDREQRILGP